jgi:hypothetical protein
MAFNKLCMDGASLFLKIHGNPQILWQFCKEENI